MDKDELIGALREVDEELSSPCDVVLVGGASMILHFGASRATRDVDALFLRGDTAELRRAIREVSRKHDLPEAWMNDAVKGFAEVLSRDFYHRLVPLDLQFKHLRLYVLGRAEQVAMKVVALREQDRKTWSCSHARCRTTIAVDWLRSLSSWQSRSDWAQKIHYFMLEQGWKTE